MPRNSVDDRVEWLSLRPGYKPEIESEYRTARSGEQLRVAEDLRELLPPRAFCSSTFKDTASFPGKSHPHCTIRFML